VSGSSYQHNSLDRNELSNIRPPVRLCGVDILAKTKDAVLTAPLRDKAMRSLVNRSRVEVAIAPITVGNDCSTNGHFAGLFGIERRLVIDDKCARGLLHGYEVSLDGCDRTAHRVVLDGSDVRAFAIGNPIVINPISAHTVNVRLLVRECGSKTEEQCHRGDKNSIAIFHGALPSVSEV
jgi:hypothetical protein